ALRARRAGLGQRFAPPEGARPLMASAPEARPAPRGLPVVAIVGRPNVGKSTLFNRLVGARRAIVDDAPGVTRDRVVAPAAHAGRAFLCVDTGGFTAEPPRDRAALAARVHSQTLAAVAEADCVLCVLAGAAGLAPEDRETVRLLRRSGQPVVSAVTKLDTRGREPLLHDFPALGLDRLLPLSAPPGRARRGGGAGPRAARQQVGPGRARAAGAGRVVREPGGRAAGVRRGAAPLRGGGGGRGAGRPLSARGSGRARRRGGPADAGAEPRPRGRGRGHPAAQPRGQGAALLLRHADRPPAARRHRVRERARARAGAVHSLPRRPAHRGLPADGCAASPGAPHPAGGQRTPGARERRTYSRSPAAETWRPASSSALKGRVGVTTAIAPASLIEAVRRAEARGSCAEKRPFERSCQGPPRRALA